jgi:hypothetical protein
VLTTVEEVGGGGRLVAGGATVVRGCRLGRER